MHGGRLTNQLEIFPKRNGVLICFQNCKLVDSFPPEDFKVSDEAAVKKKTKHNFQNLSCEINILRVCKSLNIPYRTLGSGAAHRLQMSPPSWDGELPVSYRANKRASSVQAYLSGFQAVNMKVSGCFQSSKSDAPPKSYLRMKDSPTSYTKSNFKKLKTCWRCGFQAVHWWEFSINWILLDQHSADLMKKGSKWLAIKGPDWTKPVMMHATVWLGCQ